MDGFDEAPGWLLGRWRLLRAEPGLDLLPGAQMEFRGGGDLRYTLTVEGREAVFTLRYRVEAGVLYTAHEAGQKAQVGLSLDVDKGLELDFAGRRAWFVRESLM